MSPVPDSPSPVFSKPGIVSKRKRKAPSGILYPTSSDSVISVEATDSQSHEQGHLSTLATSSSVSRAIEESTSPSQKRNRFQESPLLVECKDKVSVTLMLENQRFNFEFEFCEPMSNLVHELKQVLGDSQITLDIRTKAYTGEMVCVNQEEHWSRAGMINGGTATLRMVSSKVGASSQEALPKSPPSEWEFKVCVRFSPPDPLTDEEFDRLHSIEKLPVATAHKTQFLGSTINMLKDPLNFLLYNAEAVGEKYGLFRVELPGTTTVVVCSPDMVAQVLNQPWIYKKGKNQLRVFEVIMGNGLFNNCGRYWGFDRNVRGQCYQSTFIQTLVKKFDHYITLMLDSWSNEEGANFIANGQPFNLQTQVIHCMTDAYADFFFSGQFEMSENKNCHPVGVSVVQSLHMIQSRALYILFPMLTKADPQPGNIQYSHYVETVKSYVRQEVAQRRVSSSYKQRCPKDMLDMLLCIQDVETGVQYTDDQIVDEIMSDFYSSVNPNDTAIQWFIYELCRHQQVQAKAYAEIEREIGQGVPSWNDVMTKFPYLSMVLSEAMRLHPVAPCLSREAEFDGNLGHFFIPQGTQVNVCTWALHRDRRFWSNPSFFDPERFSPYNRHHIPTYAYFPFGVGPRECMGYELGWGMSKLFAIRLLQRFRIELADPKVEIEPSLCVTLKAKPSIQCKITRRSGPTIPHKQCLPQFASPKSLQERGSQLERTAKQYQSTMHIDDPILQMKLPNLVMPPFLTHYDTLQAFSHPQNMPASDLLAIVTGVLRAQVNLRWVKARKAIQHVMSSVEDFANFLVKKSPKTQSVNDYIQDTYGMLSSSLCKIPDTSIGIWLIDDREFGRQRVGGQHGCAIRRWMSKELPFPLPQDTPPNIRSRIQNAVKQERLFHVNYEVAHIPTHLLQPGCFLPCPWALFDINEHQDLMPIGIYFHKDRKEPLLVTPEDDPLLWLLAKINTACADGHFQQFVSHFPNTHLVGEVFALAFEKSISHEHPLYTFLSPHFRANFEINYLARVILMSPGGLVDQAMSCGRIGAFYLTSETYKSWKFSDNDLETNLKERGVDDPKILPHYPYRDCGRIINNAFRKFVTDMIYYIYPSDQDIVLDGELTQFIFQTHELFRKSRGDTQFEFPERIQTRKELIHILTSLLFTVCVQHSTLNYGDLEYRSFIPNSPTVLHTDFPHSKKVPLCKEDIVAALPSATESLKIIGFAKLLSSPPLPSDTLGQSDMIEVYGFTDPAAVEMVREFQQELRGPVTEAMKKIHAESQEKYGRGYPWMFPDNCTYSVQI